MTIISRRSTLIGALLAATPAFAQTDQCNNYI